MSYNELVTCRNLEIFFLIEKNGRIIKWFDDWKINYLIYAKLRNFIFILFNNLFLKYIMKREKVKSVSNSKSDNIRYVK